MKKVSAVILILLAVFALVSCKTISEQEKLIGTWVYSREPEILTSVALDVTGNNIADYLVGEVESYFTMVITADELVKTATIGKMTVFAPGDTERKTELTATLSAEELQKIQASLSFEEHLPYTVDVASHHLSVEADNDSAFEGEFYFPSKGELLLVHQPSSLLEYFKKAN